MEYLQLKAFIPVLSISIDGMWARPTFGLSPGIVHNSTVELEATQDLQFG